MVQEIKIITEDRSSTLMCECSAQPDIEKYHTQVLNVGEVRVWKHVQINWITHTKEWHSINKSKIIDRIKYTIEEIITTNRFT